MDRRNFLKAGAVAGGSMGLGAVGCGAVMEGMTAVPVPSIAELQALDMEGFLKRLDTSLGFIQSQSSVASLVTKDAQSKMGKDPRFESAGPLVRKTLRSLLLTSSFHELPEAGRLHPGMQARLWNSMADMDEAVLGMNKLMTSFTPTERADLHRALREDPTLTAAALKVLDEEGEKAGVTDARRKHLQNMGKAALFRLRQSTTSFIDEYDEKVTKYAARDMTLETVQRRFMAQMGEDAFWEYHARQSALAAQWLRVPGVAQGAPPAGTAPTSVGVGGAATATAILTATGVPVNAPTASGTNIVVPPPGTMYGPPPGYGPGAVPPGYGPPGYGPPGPMPSDYGTLDAYTKNMPDPELDSEGHDIKKLRRGNILLGVGGGLLGLGLILLAAGVAIMSSSTATIEVGGMFVLTAAGLSGIAGIVLLIVGAVLRARA
ncbi:MAG: twin-arginine translocation signal domain-containing protein [Polyangiaceae bacterium]